MSYDADLINAYRNQLARIRQAWQVFKADDFTDCGVYEGFVTQSMEAVDTAINSTEADDIENLYRPQVPASGYQTTPSDNQLNTSAARQGDFYVWKIDDEDNK